MGKFDDNVAVIGNWGDPNPIPRPPFSAMLGDDSWIRSIQEPVTGNENGKHFTGPEEPSVSSESDENNGAQAGLDDEYSTKSSALFEQKASLRGGLLERVTARTGFNAPRLNTESIRPAEILNPNIRSPYLTLSPGISPTTLLESPVFLSNSLVQPSPTTGQFPFGPNWNSRSSTLNTGAADISKSNFFADFDSSSFAFKPFAEAAPSFFLGAASKKIPTDNALPSQSIHSGTTLRLQSDFSKPPLEKDVNGNAIASEQTAFESRGNTEHPLPYDEQRDEELDSRVSEDTVAAGGAPSEDGYNWRKYGQKQVKGSDYPRSYYKCTHANCPVKKKVERSPEGHITEIIYKGAHNHTKPPPNRRLASTAGGSPDGDPAHNGAALLESADAVDAPSMFSNDEDEDDSGSIPLGCDGEEDESESKRRKMETYAAEISGATRSIREPRVVVQTTSEVDILDDGYRWRKYGQKVVKGNPNPRSYYKCTSAGCTVRKHVERASHDLKSVITTYEGKHNHDVPAARSGNSSMGTAQAHRTEAPSHVHNRTALGSFGLPHVGPFPFGANQSGMGLGSFTNPGSGPRHEKLSVHHNMGQPQQHQQHSGNENGGGFMLAKGEQPMLEIMSRLPQM